MVRPDSRCPMTIPTNSDRQPAELALANILPLVIVYVSCSNQDTQLGNGSGRQTAPNRLAFARGNTADHCAAGYRHGLKTNGVVC